MDLAATIQDDLLLMDGLEAIALLPAGQTTPVEIEQALRRNVSTREVTSSEGRYRAGDVAWHLPTSQFAELPRLGSTIEDADGQRWTVLEARRDTLGARWRCVTRNLAIDAGLNQLVDIQISRAVKDASGAMRAEFMPFLSAVRAALQPISSAPDEQNALRRNAGRYECIVDRQLPMETEKRYRVIDGNGKSYRVTGYESPQRIDELPRLILEDGPWPL